MNAITNCPSRLLVIEDDPVLSADLGDYFRDRNHRVTLCRDGGEGLTLAREEGLEINILGLNFGLNPFKLRLKLPGIGSVGS